MDRTSVVIIKICIFSIVLSLTALLLCTLFYYWTGKDADTWTIKNSPTVIIDAGHGGMDSGASCEGVYEKELNLSLALMLGDMLKSSGYEVIQTRSDDIMLGNGAKGSVKMADLKERVNLANSYDNAVFVSIHMNKFSQEKYSGLQVFYSKNNKSSASLAEKIQSNVKTMLQSGNNREIKQAGSNIFLLDNIDTPAVLVECGFLSNPDERKKLSTDEYRKELASVIYSSVVEFLEDV